MKCEKSVKGLILKQFELYPKILIQDMVKFIYQNEFAGGHFISNGANSLERLLEEVKGLDLEHKQQNADVFEEIGNGLSRLHIVTAINAGLSLETLNELFVYTANDVAGTIKGMDEKLESLRACCIDGDLPFSIKDVDDFLLDYKAQGYPAMSHSAFFKTAYCPAYRIVKTEFKIYFNVFLKIDLLLKSNRSVTVAIDGQCGAGKSTLATLIHNVYQCPVMHMDDYFLTPEIRTAKRLEEIGGNVDYVRFKDEVISGLKSGKGFEYQPYDCRQMDFKPPIGIDFNRLNVVEGSYSMHPSFVEHYDLKIFLSIDEDEQSKRILKRNGEIIHKRFLSEWIPMENRYFEGMHIKERSDLVYKFI